MYMNTLKTQLEKHRNIKPNTWKSYKNQINTLNRLFGKKDKEGTLMPLENFDFLKNFENVTKTIRDPETKIGIPTQRIISSVILIMLNPKGDMTPYRRKSQTKQRIYPEIATDLYKDYVEFNGELNKIEWSEQDKQKKTDKQKANWLDWKDVLMFQDEYRRAYRRDKFNKKTELSANDVTFLRQYLIISLYTLIRPRRLDYSNMRIISADDYALMSMEAKSKENLLVIQSKIKKEFSFGSYVQKNKNGGIPVFKLPIPKELNQVLQAWFKHNDQSGLFIKNSKGNAYKGDGLSKVIYKMFEKRFNKHIGVSMLRTIYKSAYHYNDKTKKEKIQCAAEMGHSINCGELFYIKH
jgi:hypothetical protein